MTQYQMKRSICIVLLMFIMFTTVWQGPLSHAEFQYKILVLLSYDPAFPTSTDILRGLSDTFDDEIYELDIEFMDTKEIKSDEYILTFHKYLESKMLEKKPYDMIITFDDNALILQIMYCIYRCLSL